jgi:hypothetical protein
MNSRAGRGERGRRPGRSRPFAFQSPEEVLDVTKTATTAQIGVLAGEVLAGDAGAALALRDVLEERQATADLAAVVDRVRLRCHQLQAEYRKVLDRVDCLEFTDDPEDDGLLNQLDGVLGRLTDEELALDRLFAAVEPLLDVCPACGGGDVDVAYDGPHTYAARCPHCYQGRVLPDDGRVANRSRGEGTA